MVLLTEVYRRNQVCLVKVFYSAINAETRLVVKLCLKPMIFSLRLRIWSQKLFKKKSIIRTTLSWLKVIEIYALIR